MKEDIILDKFNGKKSDNKFEEEEDIILEKFDDNKILWEWEQDGGKFIPFDSSVMSILESSYQLDSNGSTTTKIFGTVWNKIYYFFKKYFS